MAEDKIEEETYSLIFTSLKHPIRRKILRMLADEPLTYSEILETLNIDSGHLSYHLESLGDLTVHDKNGHYHLSSFGVATVKLMGGVEEQTPTQSHRKSKPRRLFAKIYPVILALVLIGASFHFVTYADVVSSRTMSTDQMFPPPLYVDAGQTFEVNVTLDHWSSINEDELGIRGDSQEYVLSLAQLESTLTGWDEVSVWIDSEVNETKITPISAFEVNSLSDVNNVTSFKWYLPSGPFNESGSDWKNFTVHVLLFNNTTGIPLLKPTALFFPSKLLADIYTPNGTVLTDTFHWSSAPFRSDRISSPSVSITEPGTYSFRIRNDALWDWDGFLSVNVQLQRFEKPYFYWGIAGFIIALGYVALVTASTMKNRHKN